jgi:hypothetical protein
MCRLKQTGEPQPPKLTLVRSPIRKAKDRYEYVSEKLSSLSATVGEETPHGDDPLLLRQVRLEGLEQPCCDFIHLLPPRIVGGP